MDPDVVAATVAGVVVPAVVAGAAVCGACVEVAVTTMELNKGSCRTVDCGSAAMLCIWLAIVAGVAADLSAEGATTMSNVTIDCASMRCWRDCVRNLTWLVPAAQLTLVMASWLTGMPNSAAYLFRRSCWALAVKSLQVILTLKLSVAVPVLGALVVESG